MKFEKDMKSRMYGPWIDQYVDYKQLKKLLKQLVGEAGPGAGQAPEELSLLGQVQGPPPPCERSLRFFAQLDTEVQKADAFFERLLRQDIPNLVQRLTEARSGPRKTASCDGLIWESCEYNRELTESLSQAALFAELNLVAVRKILKKHEKLLRPGPQSEKDEAAENYLRRVQATSSFAKGDVVQYLSRLAGSASSFATQDSASMLLLLHARTGTVESVRRHLLLGGRIDYADYDQRSCLHAAVKNPDLDVLRLLLSKGAPVNARDHWGNSPLYYAVQDHLDEAAALLKQYGGFFLVGPVFAPVVQAQVLAAVRRDDGAELLRLYRLGVSVQHADASGQPLHAAAKGGHLQACEALVSCLPRDKLSLPDASGSTALRLALTHGHHEVAALLERSGATIGQAQRQLQDRQLRRLCADIHLAKDAALAALLQLFPVHAQELEGLREHVDRKLEAIFERVRSEQDRLGPGESVEAVAQAKAQVFRQLYSFVAGKLSAKDPEAGELLRSVFASLDLLFPEPGPSHPSPVASHPSGAASPVALTSAPGLGKPLASLAFSDLVPLPEDGADSRLLRSNTLAQGRRRALPAPGKRGWRSRLPVLEWAKDYRRQDFAKDFVAGLSLCAMGVPQGMAYAMLVGVPEINGLYTLLLPGVVYLLLGSSRHLAVGPLSVPCLLLGQALGSLEPQPDPQMLPFLATCAALLTGVFYLLIAGFRLGFLLSFLSRPVLSGFTTAAAMITATAQLKHLFGVSIEKTLTLHTTVLNIAGAIEKTNGPTVAISLSALAIFFALSSRTRTKPLAPLVLVVASLLLGLMVDYEELHVKIVGPIPPGFHWKPVPGFDVIALYLPQLALPTAFLATLGFLETIGVSEKWALHFGYEVDPSQDLVAVGCVNLCQAVFGGFPVMGSLSASAANVNSGAQTQVSVLVRSAGITVIILGMTGLFRSLPKCILAVIVMTAVIKMIDVQMVRSLAKMRSKDLGVWVLTVALCLFLGVQGGMVIAVSLSLLLFIANSTTVRIAELGRLKGSVVYQPADGEDPDEQVFTDGLTVLNFEAPMWYANVGHLKRELVRYGQHCRVLVLDMGCVSFVDSTGLLVLLDTCKTLKAQCDCRVVPCALTTQVKEQFAAAGALEALGLGAFPRSVHDAVELGRSQLMEVDV